MLKKLVGMAKYFVENNNGNDFDEKRLQYFMVNSLAKEHFVTFEENLSYLWKKEDIDEYKKQLQHFPAKSEGIDIVVRNKSDNYDECKIIPIELKVLKKNKYIKDYGFSVDETSGILNSSCNVTEKPPESELKHGCRAYMAQFVDVNPYVNPPSYNFTNRKEGQIVWDFLRGVRLLSTCRVAAFFQIILVELSNNESNSKTETILPKLGNILNKGKNDPVYYAKKLDRNYKWNIALNELEKKAAEVVINNNNNFELSVCNNWAIIGIHLPKQ